MATNTEKMHAPYYQPFQRNDVFNEHQLWKHKLKLHKWESSFNNYASYSAEVPNQDQNTYDPSRMNRSLHTATRRSGLFPQTGSNGYEQRGGQANLHSPSTGFDLSHCHVDLHVKDDIDFLNARSPVLPSVPLSPGSENFTFSPQVHDFGAPYNSRLPSEQEAANLFTGHTLAVKKSSENMRNLSHTHNLLTTSITQDLPFSTINDIRKRQNQSFGHAKDQISQAFKERRLSGNWSFQKDKLYNRDIYSKFSPHPVRSHPVSRKDPHNRDILFSHPNSPDKYFMDTVLSGVHANFQQRSPPSYQEHLNMLAMDKGPSFMSQNVASKNVCATKDIQYCHSLQSVSSNYLTNNNRVSHQCQQLSPVYPNHCMNCLPECVKQVPVQGVPFRSVQPPPSPQQSYRNDGLSQVKIIDVRSLAPELHKEESSEVTHKANGVTPLTNGALQLDCHIDSSISPEMHPQARNIALNSRIKPGSKEQILRPNPGSYSFHIDSTISPERQTPARNIAPSSNTMPGSDEQILKPNPDNFSSESSDCKSSSDQYVKQEVLDLSLWNRTRNSSCSQESSHSNRVECGSVYIDGRAINIKKETDDSSYQNDHASMSNRIEHVHDISMPEEHLICKPIKEEPIDVYCDSGIPSVAGENLSNEDTLCTPTMHDVNIKQEPDCNDRSYSTEVGLDETKTSLKSESSVEDNSVQQHQHSQEEYTHQAKEMESCSSTTQSSFDCKTDTGRMEIQEDKNTWYGSVQKVETYSLHDESVAPNQGGFISTAIRSRSSNQETDCDNSDSIRPPHGTKCPSIQHVTYDKRCKMDVRQEETAALSSDEFVSCPRDTSEKSNEVCLVRGVFKIKEEPADDYVQPDTAQISIKGINEKHLISQPVIEESSDFSHAVDERSSSENYGPTGDREETADDYVPSKTAWKCIKINSGEHLISQSVKQEPSDFNHTLDERSSSENGGSTEEREEITEDYVPPDTARKSIKVSSEEHLIKKSVKEEFKDFDHKLTIDQRSSSENCGSAAERSCSPEISQELYIDLDLQAEDSDPSSSCSVGDSNSNRKRILQDSQDDRGEEQDEHPQKMKRTCDMSDQSSSLVQAQENPPEQQELGTLSCDRFCHTDKKSLISEGVHSPSAASPIRRSPSETALHDSTCSSDQATPSEVPAAENQEERPQQQISVCPERIPPSEAVSRQHNDDLFRDFVNKAAKYDEIQQRELEWLLNHMNSLRLSNRWFDISHVYYENRAETLFLFQHLLKPNIPLVLKNFEIPCIHRNGKIMLPTSLVRETIFPGYSKMTFHSLLKLWKIMERQMTRGEQDFLKTAANSSEIESRLVPLCELLVNFDCLMNSMPKATSSE
ncbi:uncharacterized protein [Ptychodera flava]|uniref:uncharacterized protein n=1 Tax=Ptychodera flava TaxID=63121 RepID=UPI00396A6082